MATLDEQIATLLDALGSPEKQVALNGGQITNRSVAELQTALAALRAEKARLESATTPPVRRKQVHWTQGGKGAC
jgi:hypothetical protein